MSEPSRKLDRKRGGDQSDIEKLYPELGTLRRLHVTTYGERGVWFLGWSCIYDVFHWMAGEQIDCLFSAGRKVKL